jgi:hypothetical protein
MSFQERATGGAARVLPKGTIGAAEVMKFCAAAGCQRALRDGARRRGPPRTKQPIVH